MGGRGRGKACSNALGREIHMWHDLEGGRGTDGHLEATMCVYSQVNTDFRVK